jgi:MYXO-CTERM domain-containing protein
MLDSFSAIKSSNLASFLAPIALGSALMGLTANSAQAAGFDGSYTPLNWTKLIVQDGSVDTTNAPASITVIGSNNGSGSPGKTDFTIAAPSAGTVSFDWLFTSSDGNSKFDPFGYVLNGSFIQLTAEGIVNQSGSATFAVLAGDVFGFSQRSEDSNYGRAQSLISNFVAPTSSPTPGPTSAPAPLPLFGAAAAFGWSRQLRRRIKTPA